MALFEIGRSETEDDAGLSFDTESLVAVLERTFNGRAQLAFSFAGPESIAVTPKDAAAIPARLKSVWPT